MSSSFTRLIKNALIPKGTANIVRLTFDGPSGAAYYNKDFVYRAVDELEQYVIGRQAGIVDSSPIHQLFFELLIESACLSKETLGQSIEFFEKWEQEQLNKPAE